MYTNQTTTALKVTIMCKRSKLIFFVGTAASFLSVIMSYDFEGKVCQMQATNLDDVNFIKKELLHTVYLIIN